MRYLLALLLTLCTARADDWSPNNEWIVEITTSTSPQTFSVNFDSPNTLYVDWGDSQYEAFTTTGLKSHVYATAKAYTLRMSGHVHNVDFYTSATPTLVTRMLSCAIVDGITSFTSTFRGCVNMGGSIPTDFGKHNTALGANGYNSTFYGCIGLTGSIPTDFGRYNTSLGSYGYYLTFYGCTGLTGGIPTDFGKYNTALGYQGYYCTFQNCNKLTSVSPTLFQYNGLNTTLESTLRGCTLMTGAVPSLAGQVNVKTVNFNSSGFTGWTTCVVPTSITNVNLSGCKFTVGAVNQMLVDFDANGAVNGSLIINGGTSAAPTDGPPAGLQSKTNLLAKGWVVTTN